MHKNPVFVATFLKHHLLDVGFIIKQDLNQINPRRVLSCPDGGVFVVQGTVADSPAVCRKDGELCLRRLFRQQDVDILTVGSLYDPDIV